MSSSALWPCPHHCELWCRTDIAFEHGKPRPATNHHPRCEHVDASLIDVWKVTDGSSSYYTDSEEDARHEAVGCDDITITKAKMHQEIFEQLPEFEGF
jgi:hypothetical protein